MAQTAFFKAILKFCTTNKIFGNFFLFYMHLFTATFIKYCAKRKRMISKTCHKIFQYCSILCDLHDKELCDRLAASQCYLCTTNTEIPMQDGADFQKKSYHPVLRKVIQFSPATTATHLRVIRLRRVLTDLPPSGSSIDPASVAV